MLEKDKRRALRRFHSRRMQNKRWNKIKGWYLTARKTPLTPGEWGYLRNNHWGCGCLMCKPWKHGL